MCDNVITHSSASEITTLWRYTNVFIIIIFLTPVLTVVERRSLAGELSLSCARPAADG